MLDIHELSDDAVTELDRSACLRLLRENQLGRLAVAVAGEPDIFPVNYVVADEAILLRTAPGSKLAELTANPRVAFEIDGFDEAVAFSVIVKGTAERLEHQADIDAAEQLPLQPWIPTLKYRWVRIQPHALTGRAFRRGAEPERF